MSTEHSSIADADRHEVKHAASALVDQVLISKGDGTTKFDYLDYSKLVNTPNSHGYSLILAGDSTAASQLPSATNTPLKVEFGPAQSVTECSLAVDGTLSFLVTGEFIVVTNLKFGRTALTGVGNLMCRSVLNGSQDDLTRMVALADATSVHNLQVIRPLAIAGSGTYYTEFFRDSSGVNIGGLFKTTPSVAGWSDAASASIKVYKYLG